MRNRRALADMFIDIEVDSEHEHDLLTDEFRRELAEHGLHFEGRPYPFALDSLVLSEGQAAQVMKIAEELFACLEIVAGLYEEERAARELFPAYESAAPWMRRPARLRPTTRVCRFDGALDEFGNFRLLETNTACPGGVILQGMASRLWRDFVLRKGLLSSNVLKSTPLVDDPDLFVKVLIDAHVQQYGDKPERAAIVNLYGHFTNEVGAAPLQ